MTAISVKTNHQIIRRRNTKTQFMLNVRTLFIISAQCLMLWNQVKEDDGHNALSQELILPISLKGSSYSIHVSLCYVLTFDPAQKMLFQGDALEGSDTFQWQLGEEITWVEIG